MQASMYLVQRTVLVVRRTPIIYSALRGQNHIASEENFRGDDELYFSNHVGAFGRKTRWELFRALAILRLCSFDKLVDNSLQILHWSKKLGGGPLLRALIYSQFVGGESAFQVRNCIRKLADEGTRAMLASTMEEDIGEHSDEGMYDRNCIRILDCIRIAAAENSPSPMVQLKLSGLLPADTLVALGNLFLTSSNKLELVKNLANSLVDCSKIKKPILGSVLNEKQEQYLMRALQRLKKIATEAQTQNVRVLVDAEYTYLNPGLSLLTLATVAVYNKRFPLFWNTYQCYLKNAHQKIEEELSLILGPLSAHFGAKLVRGAYIFQERNRAEKMGIPDPVCPDYAATCNNYDTILSFLLNKASEKDSRCEFIIASHNEDSIRLAVQRMNELRIDREKGGVCFGQLYGMGDHITNPLANAGFAVYKSIPIGNLDEVLPYLARRAIENKSVILGARRERELLQKEFKRRFIN